MIFSLIGLTSFVVIFGAVLLGMLSARTVPKHHMSSETRTAVSLSIAIVGTLSALVLGLMISTASNSFSSRSNEVTGISVDLIRMHRMLERYGTEAQVARSQLRTYATAKMQELFPDSGEMPPSDEATVAMLEKTQDTILSLAPTDERQRWLRSEALTLTESLTEARWLLVEQAGASIPVPFLVILVFWLALVFGSFGLFAPSNSTAITALGLCTLAVSVCITMILDLNSPFTGLVQVSREPMRHALALIMQ
jgi:ABC-type amino acid transport system permease subunit